MVQRDEATKRLAEQALAHVNPNRVDAAYMRSDLFELRRELMEAWSGYLSQQERTRKHRHGLTCHVLERKVRLETHTILTDLACCALRCGDAYVPANSRRQAGSGATHRNVETFDATRRWAYRAVREHRGKGGGTLDTWRNQCIGHAEAFTVARHVPALDRSECHWIGRSVGRWTWEQVTEEWWSEQQARRSLASGASRRAAAERGGAGGAGGARLAHSGSRGYAIMEETALELGLLFRTLAPMRDRVNIRAVVEGFETMQHEEIAYRAGNGNAP